MKNCGSWTIMPSPGLHGTISVPGDKSISHRAAMLASVASGESVIRGFLAGEDCLNTLKAVERMGAVVSKKGDTVRIEGVRGEYRAPDGSLDLGNSGTGMRLLAGILAGQPFVSEMTGDSSLLSRPMKRIKDPLERMGAKVELLGRNNCAPVRITGGDLRSIEYHLPVASAQVKSCVLLAGMFAQGTTVVIEPGESRDHTERMLKMMGALVRTDGPSVSISGGCSAGLRAMDIRIPGDFSSAAFWMTAGCAGDSEILIENVGLNPRRTAFLDVLRRMGADIEVSTNGFDGWEPCGSLKARGSRLTGVEVGGGEIPNIIDEIPLVAVAGALAEGETVVRDAGELRVKESDRISSIVRGLSAMGVNVDEREDGFTVHGGGKIGGGVAVDSNGDHRIAMAMAVLGLSASGPIRIDDVACVATSYPGFMAHMKQLAG